MKLTFQGLKSIPTDGDLKGVNSHLRILNLQLCDHKNEKSDGLKKNSNIHNMILACYLRV